MGGGDTEACLLAEWMVQQGVRLEHVVHMPESIEIHTILAIFHSLEEDGHLLTTPRTTVRSFTPYPPVPGLRGLPVHGEVAVCQLGQLGRHVG